MNSLLKNMMKVIKILFVIMPRSSKRKQAIKELSALCTLRLQLQVFLRVFNTDDEFEDALDEVLWTALHQMLQNRYLSARVEYRSHRLQFLDDLENRSTSTSSIVSTQPWLNKNEFVIKYRTTRSCFNELLNLIRNHAVFQNPVGRQG